MARRYSTIKRSNKSLLNNKILFVVLGIILVLLVLELTNTTHLFHRSTTPPVIPTTSPSEPSTIDSGSNQSGQSSNQAPSNNPEKSKTPSSSPAQSSNLPLYAPYGDFVSNYHPGANGSPTSETSVCNTTPSATCTITFTKGTFTTSLPAQKTNSNGTTYWNWDVKKANLSTGDWTVKAVATLNGQTKTTKDPLNLSVK